MNDIRIEKVTGSKARNRFIKFAWQVYKNDENWVPPLIVDIKERLNPHKHPFFEHAEIDLFLAYKQGVLSGRIAAVLDENHNRTHNERVVFFGMYESRNDPEVAAALLDRVAEWGSERGMTVLRGPMNLSMNDECGFLVEGFDAPPVIMMTFNPPYYPTLMEQCGLVKAKDLYAFYMHKDHDTSQKVDQIVAKVKDSTHITLRTIDLKNLDQEMEKIRHIYNQGWEKNWGFVPWTDREMEYVGHKLKQIVDPDIVILAEDRGKPVGFAVGLPNYHEALIHINGRLTPLGILKLMYYRRKITGIRAIVFGVLKEYRMTGLSYYLYWQLEKNSLAKGYTWAETSWQLEDNYAINRFVASLGGKVYKKYRIYEKSIPDKKPD